MIIKWILTQNIDRLIKVKDIESVYCEKKDDAYLIICELYNHTGERIVLGEYHFDWQAARIMKNLAHKCDRVFEKCLCNKCDPLPVITAAEPDKPIKRKGFFRKWGNRDE